MADVLARNLALTELLLLPRPSFSVGVYERIFRVLWVALLAD